MAGQLAGKVALITGAVRRNGRAMAHALAREGAAIVVNTRRSKDEAEKVRGEIEGMGRQALVCIADITDEASVARMFGEIDKRFGRIDILVNNAADRHQAPFEKMTTAEWRGNLAIVLDGAFFCSRAAIPHMLKNGWGRIVNISGAGHHMSSYIGRAHVAAGKAGLEGLTRALAVEYATRNITVNCVSPGRVGGERAKSAGTAPNPEMVPPIGRTGVPEDISAAVHFLCLPSASFITGQVLHVNGGQFLP
ncbi:MAG TPA: SDR family oxidoreductase [Burkholderiales bacterium]|nr:SDR family oxidoreductase [Burkholderiales bacterium]